MDTNNKMCNLNEVKQFCQAALAVCMDLLLEVIIERTQIGTVQAVGCSIIIYFDIAHSVACLSCHTLCNSGTLQPRFEPRNACTHVSMWIKKG